MANIRSWVKVFEFEQVIRKMWIDIH